VEGDGADVARLIGEELAQRVQSNLTPAERRELGELALRDRDEVGELALWGGDELRKPARRTGEPAARPARGQGANRRLGLTGARWPDADTGRRARAGAHSGECNRSPPSGREAASDAG
jgi:hypothetical protein